MEGGGGGGVDREEESQRAENRRAPSSTGREPEWMWFMINGAAPITFQLKDSLRHACDTAHGGFRQASHQA